MQLIMPHLFQRALNKYKQSGLQRWENVIPCSFVADPMSPLLLPPSLLLNTASHTVAQAILELTMDPRMT